MHTKLFVLLLLITCLTGCANSNQSDTVTQQQPVAAGDTTTPKPFVSGIFVDFAKYKDDFITDEILNKLQDNLKALVAKDEVTFKTGLLEGHDTPGNLAYVKNTNQYQFTDISFTKYNPDNKSIMISLSVRIWRDHTVDDSTITYYFTPDATGIWKIALID